MNQTFVNVLQGIGVVIGAGIVFGLGWMLYELLSGGNE